MKSVHRNETVEVMVETDDDPAGTPAITIRTRGRSKVSIDVVEDDGTLFVTTENRMQVRDDHNSHAAIHVTKR